MTTTTEHKWQNEDEGFMCNVDYLDPVKNSPNGSPGKLDSLDLCKSRCEKNPKCQSITYFSNSKLCSHFGAPCEHKIEPKKAISWTLIRNAGLPSNETPCIFALGVFGLNTHLLITLETHKTNCSKTFPAPQRSSRNPKQNSKPPSTHASESRQTAIAPRGRTARSGNGTCPRLPTCVTCSKVRHRSTRTSLNGEYHA